MRERGKEGWFFEFNCGLGLIFFFVWTLTLAQKDRESLISLPRLGESVLASIP